MSLHHWVCVNYGISPYGKHVGWNTSRVDLSQSFFLAFSASPLSPPFFAHFILITTLCWTCNHVSWLPGPLICAISPPISVIKTGVWNQSCVCVFTSTLRGWSGVSSGRGHAACGRAPIGFLNRGQGMTHHDTVGNECKESVCICNYFARLCARWLLRVYPCSCRVIVSYIAVARCNTNK